MHDENTVLKLTLDFFEKMLDVNDFQYDLPQERIALYPLPQRDHSRLLKYEEGNISHHHFYDIADHLPQGSSLFFNETKVIPARIHFQKNSGATIEIFLLHPTAPSSLLIDTMQAVGSTDWKCTIGNLKRWTNESVLSRTSGNVELSATLIDRNEGIVRFTWTGEYTFAEILHQVGKTPLPPYLKRSAEDQDVDRYQTVYSNKEGAVAAPTAGLHFTGQIIQTLRSQNIPINFLTLHVSAGTFQPIKVNDALQHTMHQEQIIVTRANIERLISSKKVVAVGTTSLRTLESLYWYGVKLQQYPDAPFLISQTDSITLDQDVSLKSSIETVAKHMTKKGVDVLTGETSIYIVPGYRFRVVDALITNFHQPGSTLILLVAAFVGNDWKRIYDEALAKEYRFLSFGDSSILIRS